MAELSRVKLLLDECHWTLLIISQHWIRQWLGAVRLQTITWANVDSDPFGRIVSLGINYILILLGIWNANVILCMHMFVWLFRRNGDWWLYGWFRISGENLNIPSKYHQFRWRYRVCRWKISVLSSLCMYLCEIFVSYLGKPSHAMLSLD